MIPTKSIHFTYTSYRSIFIQYFCPVSLIHVLFFVILSCFSRKLYLTTILWVTITHINSYLYLLISQSQFIGERGNIYRENGLILHPISTLQHSSCLHVWLVCKTSWTENSAPRCARPGLPTFLLSAKHYQLFDGVHLLSHRDFSVFSLFDLH